MCPKPSISVHGNHIGDFMKINVPNYRFPCIASLYNLLDHLNDWRLKIYEIEWYIRLHKEVINSMF